jgi:hypothetical protein
MLHNFLTPEINRCGINQQTMWFQKGRASAHTARASMAVVQELHQCDWANRFAFAQNMLEIVTDDATIGMSDETHFHWVC